MCGQKNAEYKQNERGDDDMATAQEYEAYKRYLATLNITVKEYQNRLRKWCKKMGY